MDNAQQQLGRAGRQSDDTLQDNEHSCKAECCRGKISIMTKLLRKYRFELWHCRPQLWLAQPTRPRLQPANHRRRPGTLLRHTWRIGIPQGQKSSYFHPEWRISPQNPRNSVVAAADLSEARSSSGSISSLLRWKDRRKTAVSQQQYLDKVDRLLISWVTNHLGFSSVFTVCILYSPNLGAAGRRGNKRFYKWILSKYSFLSPGRGSAELIIFKCNVAIFASEL